jgi:hypothetical protein
VTFADWNRLVDLFERQMRSLVSHGVPVGIQAAAFDEAVRRVVRSLDERPRVFWLSPGVPIGTQIAAFDEALNRVLRSMNTDVAKTPPSNPRRAPVELLPEGKRADEIDREYGKRAQHLTRIHPRTRKGPL